ncbi:MAG: LPS-assembly protein LptD, partial [Betaproteobacteria bacterium]|nr:LPS-assembly protein LptD [Betaproteobacteria bacterium]
MPPAGGGEPSLYGTYDSGPGLTLRQATGLTPLPKNSDLRPTFLAAQRMYGVNDREAVMEGDAELRKSGTVLTADKLVYWQADDEVEATGHVVYTQEGTKVTGPRLFMRLGEQTGVFDQAAYSVRQERKVPVWGVMGNAQAMGTHVSEGRGTADRLDFLGENHLRLANATYTTCSPGNNDWYMKVDNLELNYERDEGEGDRGILYFKDVPIFYMPTASFPLNNQRKSGFLAPTFGSNSISGLDLTTPYYWNIAPNMDATIAPRILSKRGLQVGGELQYLNYGYQGYARGEYLPGDNLRHIDRYAFNLSHTQNFGNGFSGQLNLNKVSDDNYYTDLASRIGIASQAILLRQGALSYSSMWWNATANVQRYQMIQPDPNNLVAQPYALAPQLTLNARRPDYYGADVSLLGQYSYFDHPTQVIGQRTVLFPQVAFPLIYPSFYVTPKIGLHLTQYSLSRQAEGVPDSISRNVPIFSLDSGVTFEREMSMFGRNFTQTLEPRLYYVYIPYRDQSILNQGNVNFDSGLADFNFAQIFSPNRYVGQDRIGDANQLTAAVSTRFINPQTGAEYFRAMAGQRYYFADQRVTLPGEIARVHNNTNWLGAVSGQVLPKTYLDAAVEYNPWDQRTDRLSVVGRYQPEAGRVFNAGYRFIRDVLDQIDV